MKSLLIVFAFVGVRALVRVIAREFPEHRFFPILAYGLASTVSVARVAGPWLSFSMLSAIRLNLIAPWMVWLFCVHGDSLASRFKAVLSAAAKQSRPAGARRQGR